MRKTVQMTVCLDGDIITYCLDSRILTPLNSCENTVKFRQPIKNLPSLRRDKTELKSCRLVGFVKSHRKPLGLHPLYVPDRSEIADR